MREGERFTEEIGVLEALGGDEKDLQLPVHHVCRCLCSSSIDDCSFLMRCSCRERREIQRRRHFPLGDQTRASVTYMERKSHGK